MRGSLLIRGYLITTYVDKTRGGGGQKISVFVHTLGIKTVKKWQNSVHVVVE